MVENSANVESGKLAMKSPCTYKLLSLFFQGTQSTSSPPSSTTHPVKSQMTVLLQLTPVLLYWYIPIQNLWILKLKQCLSSPLFKLGVTCWWKIYWKLSEIGNLLIIQKRQPTICVYGVISLSFLEKQRTMPCSNIVPYRFMSISPVRFATKFSIPITLSSNIWDLFHFAPNQKMTLQ